MINNLNQNITRVWAHLEDPLYQVFWVEYEDGSIYEFYSRVPFEWHFKFRPYGKYAANVIRATYYPTYERGISDRAVTNEPSSTKHYYTIWCSAYSGTTVILSDDLATTQEIVNSWNRTSDTCTHQVMTLLLEV